MRIDYHFGHYMKVLLDEIFGKENFRNEIIVNRSKIAREGLSINKFAQRTDTIFYYTKTANFIFNGYKRPRKCSYCGAEKQQVWIPMHSPSEYKIPERTILGKVLLPPKGRHWSFSQDKIDKYTKEKRIRINKDITYLNIKGEKVIGMPEYLQSEHEPADSDWTDIPGYAWLYNYPTENSEFVLERII
ncbi:MAG: site-specific DNA-methyltransferase, partial [Caldisericia bacterium]|nr:site-specific DNA-methyltransferase [Caldisericia bacterium]